MRQDYFSGSSPRLRGTLLENAGCLASWRFIPAPAGNAEGVLRPQAEIAVHPRACGERPAGFLPLRRGYGSSPRLRGTQVQRPASQGIDRFIPAPAGNATACNLPASVHSVHPRACGERANTSGATSNQGGSSPRLRGTLAQHGCADPRFRFIPAPAGNAWPGLRVVLLITVHPRACGERPNMTV